MSKYIEIDSNLSHIRKELDPCYGQGDTELDGIIDSIKDATIQIDSDAMEMSNEISENEKKIDELENEIEDLKDDLQGSIKVDFVPACEYIKDSMVGKIACLSDNLADDQTLYLFSTLVEHIKPQELTEHLKGILRKYPNLITKLALNV